MRSDMIRYMADTGVTGKTISTAAKEMTKVPLQGIVLLDLQGKETRLTEHAREFLLLIFLRHLA